MWALITAIGSAFVLIVTAAVWLIVDIRRFFKQRGWKFWSLD